MAAIHSTARWQRLRLHILTRDLWTCQMCGVMLLEGRANSASAVVDHIKPAILCPDIAHDESNLRAVCKKCHDGPCASIEARTRNPEEIELLKRAHHKGAYDRTGRPMAPDHPWNQQGR